MIRYIFFALITLMLVGVAYLALVQPPAPTKAVVKTLSVSDLPAAPAAPNPQIIPSNTATPTVPMADE
jgi:hypothetical protein